MQAEYNVDTALTAIGVDLERTTLAGAWVPGDGPEHLATDPATALPLAQVRESTQALVDRVVVAGRTALPAWRWASQEERSRTLERAAAAIVEQADALAVIECVDTGKPLSQAADDVRGAAAYFRFYASAARHLYGTTIEIDRTRSAVAVHEPYGVVAHITPWNAPLSQFARGVAPSLAVGNVVVLKPPELAPLSSIALATVLARVLPPGIVGLVPGSGPVTGAALAAHPGIDHLTFTGSVRTGIEVARAAAANVVMSNLELGGKSAALVLVDADLPTAVRYARSALIRNSGQSCSALSRFLVHRSRYDEFVTGLRESASGLRVDAGINDPDLGPLISAAQRDRVTTLLGDAVADGATAHPVGVELPGHLDGYFLEPVVLTDVTPDSPIAGAEIFGPVQTVLAFDDLDEGIAIANGTDYGLAAAVFTRDLDAAARSSAHLAAGQVHVNGYSADVTVPFGGYKHSGHGREKGFAALLGYTQVKAVVTHAGAGAPLAADPVAAR